jgi:multidrug resistance efflux pump
MENKKPKFAITDHSLQSIVTELHNYFRDLQSYYNIAKGALVSKLDNTTDQATVDQLQAELKAINEKLLYFHVLNNSISTVDTVVHTSKMIDELKN